MSVEITVGVTVTLPHHANVHWAASEAGLQITFAGPEGLACIPGFANDLDDAAGELDRSLNAVRDMPQEPAK